MIDLFFLSIMEIPFRIHQQPNPALPHDACTGRRLIVPATGANIVLCCDQQFSHRGRSQIAGHGEVSNFIATKVRYLSGPVTLMPVGSDKNPSVLPNFRQKGFVNGSDVRGDILLVEAIPNASSVELVLDFRTVPVFVKIKGEVRQPFL